MILAIALVAVCICGLWKAAISYGVRLALIERHQDVWLNLSRDFFFFPQLSWFLWFGNPESLNDEVITRNARTFRILTIVIIAAAIVVVIFAPYSLHQ